MSKKIEETSGQENQDKEKGKEDSQLADTTKTPEPVEDDSNEAETDETGETTEPKKKRNKKPLIIGILRFFNFIK